MKEELAAALTAGGGVIVRRDHLGRRPMFEGPLARRELVTVLPGVYAEPSAAGDLSIKALAVARHDPDAVITGAAAAALTWWPELPVSTISAARAHHFAEAAGFKWEKRHIPTDRTLQVGRARVTAPALTVLDLIPTLGGRAVDEALRRHAVTLEQLWRALDETPNRRGNRERARLLIDSRDEPWSEAERAFHQLMRATRVRGWHANHQVAVSESKLAYLDVAIPEILLDLEVDGREYHGGGAAFINDRRRDARLAALGWQVIRCAASDIGTFWTKERLHEVIQARAAALGVPAPLPRRGNRSPGSLRRRMPRLPKHRAAHDGAIPPPEAGQESRHC